MELRQGLFEFQWQRCPDGYRLDERRSDGPAFSYVGTVPFIVPISSEQERYSPMLAAPDLHRRLADIEPSADGMIQFVNQFGLLGGSWHEPPKEMGYNAATEFQAGIAELVHSKRSSKIRAASFNKWSESAQFTILMDPNGRMFHVVPKNLSNFILLRLATELSGDVEWRRCANPRCNETFMVARGRGAVSSKAVGTIRKETCGKEACRKAFQRLRAKGEEI
jgi:hypothetical protein